MKRPLTVSVCLAIAVLTAGCGVQQDKVTAFGVDTDATKLLKQRSKALQPTVTRVSKSVYCASGYSPATIAMIVGDDGILIVDTGMFPAHAQAVLKEFRKITDLPVAGVVLTHGHGDHTGGVRVFLDAGAKDAKPMVYARAPFNTEGAHFISGGVTINKARGARQGGFRLPPEKRINNGIAPAVYPPKEKNVFIGDPVKPDITFDQGRKKIRVAGIDMELVAAPGETSDQLYCWFAAEKVVFTGDNFYRSWPNLYAIRGTAYRDVRAWIKSLDMMLAQGPEHAVGGHTLPLIGKKETTEVLASYRDAIKHVFDATIEGINKGMTPDELVHHVKLPPELASRDHLREFYGNVQWGVRAIFNGYLGWFDGNPTNLFSLPPAEEAAKMARLAGGTGALASHARKALENGEAQWCAQLCDHLIALNPDAKDAKRLKADALERLAENLVTATGRNYYLTVAQELRAKAKE
jgi:uncharacterized sulfatase